MEKKEYPGMNWRNEANQMDPVSEDEKKASALEKKDLGKKLKAARENTDVTQQMIADASAMSVNHISAIERGVSNPTVRLLEYYSKLTRKSPNEILEWNNIQSQRQAEQNHIKPEILDLLSDCTDDEQTKIYNMLKAFKGE